jgi:MFS family permease
MKFVTDLRLLLLAIWLGAALFFIAVAGSAFAVLPQREMAGLIVNRTLSILNYSGLGIAAVLIATSVIGAAGTKAVTAWAERILLGLIAVSCAVGQFVIGLMLSSIRGQMGGRPIDDIPVDDPLRVQFNQLHEYSVWVLFVGMGAALIAFFVIAGRGSRRTAAASSKGITNDPFDFTKEFRKS